MVNRKSLAWLVYSALLLLIALFFILRSVMSWRPVVVVRAVNNHNSYVDDWLDVSNRYLFYISSNIDNNPGPTIGPGASLCVLSPGGKWQQTAVSEPPGSPVVTFIAEGKIVVWGIEYVGENNMTLRGLLFDCQTMQKLRELQSLTLTNHNSGWTIQDGRGFARKQNVVYVSAFGAIEWSLKTGRLLHCWKLRRPGDDPYLTNTIYSPFADTFVQNMGGRIRVWSAETGRLIHTSAKRLEQYDDDYGEGDSPSNIRISPDGALVAYNSSLPNGAAGPIRVARCDTAQTLWQMRVQVLSDGLNFRLGDARFSHDGQEIFFWSSHSHNFAVHKSHDGHILRRLAGPPSLSDFWLTPDGAQLYSVDAQGNIWRQRAS